ncbi:hypothetical protein AB0K09_30540 [Streptomyces sp. NPDC049577]|uniref:hypothetical protein n=1 Tax=Streptomyces sp. NPDC049577 TaxID=3155153 RepID=UPI00342B3730
MEQVPVHYRMESLVSCRWVEVAMAVVAVRTFTPDLVTAGRHLLGVGVRLGAAEIARERRDAAMQERAVGEQAGEA